jgi:hypothetical protein
MPVAYTWLRAARTSRAYLWIAQTAIFDRPTAEPTATGHAEPALGPTATAPPAAPRVLAGTRWPRRPAWSCWCRPTPPAAGPGQRHQPQGRRRPRRRRPRHLGAGGRPSRGDRHRGPNRRRRGVLLRKGAASATAIGRASDAIPTRDGRGLWLWCWSCPRPSTLAEVGLDGRPRWPAVRLDCGARPVADTDRGLLAQVEGPDADAPTAALPDPRDGHRLATYPEVIAVAGDLVLSGGEADQGPFTLTDRRTGGRRLVPRPPRGGSGRRRAAQPRPAPAGGRVRRPGLARRPGQDRLAVRRLRLPADRAGSDSFVPR